MERFQDSFDRTGTAEDPYRRIACLIAMACSRIGGHDRAASGDLSFKWRFLRCREIKRNLPNGEARYDGRCGVRRFCPYCNFVLRENPLLTYVPAFDRGHWYSMTISSTRSLDFFFDEATDAWDAGRSAVQALVEAGQFQGAYATEEIHLESLWPEATVLPHTHVIFHTNTPVSEAATVVFAEGVFQRHFAMLRQRAADEGDDITVLEPSIDLKVLPTKVDLYRACDYLTKTVRMLGAYEDALERAGAKLRWQVNGNFEEFLHGMILVVEEDYVPKAPTENRKKGSRSKRRKKGSKDKVKKKRYQRTRQQRYTLGSLRAGRGKSFVGIRSSDRHSYRSEVRGLQAQAVEHRAAENREPGVGHPFDL